MNPFRSIIENFVERCLGDDRRGHTIFFPWWGFGPGYILPDAGFTRALIRLLSGYFSAFLIFVIMYTLLGSLFAFYPKTLAGTLALILGIFAFWAGLYWFLVRRVTRELEKSRGNYQELWLNRGLKKRR